MTNTTPGTARQSRPASVGDIVVSVILLIAGGVGFIMLAVLSLLLGMVSDGCGSESDCNFDLLGVGFVIALVGPPVSYLTSLVWTIVRLKQRRRGWWVPLAGAVVALAVWGVGYAMLVTSVA